MKLELLPIDDLHQLLCAARRDSGFICYVANRLYACHVAFLSYLIRRSD